jgi:hypothetical protein
VTARSARQLFGILAAALLPSLPLALSASAPEPLLPAMSADELIRRVVRSQRRAEEVFAGSTYDQVEVETTYGKDGRPKETKRKLYYVFAEEAGKGSTRELVTVNDRPATADEKKDSAAEDAKQRRRQVEREAAAKAKAPPKVSGDEDDPLVGTRRLSELIGRFDVTVMGEEIAEGRPAYVLTFRPSGRIPAKSIGERALDALAGRVLIDAVDFQIRSVEAHLTKPVKVAGGLAANVKEAEVSYEGLPVGARLWFPCTIDFRLKGKKGLFFRLDAGYRFEFANLKSFFVETESTTSPEPPAGGPPP